MDSFLCKSLSCMDYLISEKGYPHTPKFSSVGNLDNQVGNKYFWKLSDT